MMTVRGWGIAVALTMAGCGTQADAHLSSVTLTWQAPLTNCAARSTVGQRLEVSMMVGGFSDPCDLAVDPTSLSASSECGPFRTGSVRPILVTYEQRDPDSATHGVPIAYFVSFVNLCDDHLKAGQSVVDLSLVNDGTTGKLIYQQSDLDAVTPGTPLPSCTNGLNEALQWAVGNGIPKGQRLDANCNCSAGASAQTGCSNLEEACANTLFPVGPGCG